MSALFFSVANIAQKITFDNLSPYADESRARRVNQSIQELSLNDRPFLAKVKVVCELRLRHRRRLSRAVLRESSS